PIKVLARDKISGTHDAFMSLVMHGTQLKATRMFEDSEALVREVRNNPGAIGFVGLAYTKQVKSLAIQDGDAQALLPTPFTAATEDYALARRLFFYTPTAPKDPLVRELVDYTLSEPGQTIVGEIGFVPLSLRAEVSASPADAPPAYAELVSGATRLSVNF